MVWLKRSLKLPLDAQLITLRISVVPISQFGLVILWKCSWNSVDSWLQCPSFTVRHTPTSQVVTSPLKTYYSNVKNRFYNLLHIYESILPDFYLNNSASSIHCIAVCSSGRFWLTVGVKKFTIHCTHLNLWMNLRFNFTCRYHNHSRCGVPCLGCGAMCRLVCSCVWTNCLVCSWRAAPLAWMIIKMFT